MYATMTLFAKRDQVQSRIVTTLTNRNDVMPMLSNLVADITSLGVNLRQSVSSMKVKCFSSVNIIKINTIPTSINMLT